MPLPVPSAPVLFEIVPPVQLAALVQVPPLAVTVRPPVPAPFRMMPLLEPLPLEVMLRKVRPLVPIVVLATFSAVAVVVVSVFTIVLLFCVALTVPPPVAANAALAPVLRLRP